MIGNWQAAIMSIVNVPRQSFSSKHGACPSCGGSDRYRFDDNIDYKGDGGAYCNQCGAGSGLTWLMKLSGMTFPESMEALGSFLNMTPIEKLELIRKEMPKLNNSSNYLTAEEVSVIMGKCKNGVIKGKSGDLRVFEMLESDTMKPCNVAFIDKNNRVSYKAGFNANEYIRGRITRGAVTPIGNKSEYTYLVANYDDACKASNLTGAHVWCCWTPENMWEVVRSVSDDVRSKLRCIINLDFDEICAAENADLKILIPDDGNEIRCSRAIRKKLYNPDDLFAMIKN